MEYLRFRSRLDQFNIAHTKCTEPQVTQDAEGPSAAALDKCDTKHEATSSNSTFVIAENGLSSDFYDLLHLNFRHPWDVAVHP